jgi:hypothetical protein
MNGEVESNPVNENNPPVPVNANNPQANPQVNPSNPQIPKTASIFTRQIFYLIGSSVFMLFSFFYKKWLKKNYENFKKAKVLSVKEFLSNQRYLKDEEVIVSGKYFKDRIDPYSFYLLRHENFSYLALEYLLGNYVKIAPDNSYIFNARKGHLDKDLINSSLIFDTISFLLLYKTFQSLNLSFILHLHNNQLHEQYFLDSDIIGVYGTVTNTKKYLAPKFIFQGNTKIFKNLLKSQIFLWDRCFKFSAISIVCQLLVMGIDIFLKKILPNWLSYFNKSTFISRENCVKCKVNFANVVMNDCNHFNLCFKCFKAMDEKCQICKVKISDYYILYN